MGRPVAETLSRTVIEPFDRGPHYIGFNPLQQVAYTGIYAVALGALLTGFTLYAQLTPDLWFSAYFLSFGNLVEFQTLRLVHLLVS